MVCFSCEKVFFFRLISLSIDDVFFVFYQLNCKCKNVLKLSRKKIDIYNKNKYRTICFNIIVSRSYIYDVQIYVLSKAIVTGDFVVVALVVYQLQSLSRIIYHVFNRIPPCVYILYMFCYLLWCANNNIYAILFCNDV